jgi:hypothetical protein
VNFSSSHAAADNAAAAVKRKRKRDKERIGPAGGGGGAISAGEGRATLLPAWAVVELVKICLGPLSINVTAISR